MRMTILTKYTDYQGCVYDTTREIIRVTRIEPNEPIKFSYYWRYGGESRVYKIPGFDGPSMPKGKDICAKLNWEYVGTVA